VGAPIGIGLVAGIAFPAMIIGWLRYYYKKHVMINIQDYAARIMRRYIFIWAFIYFIFRYTSVGRTKVIYEIRES